MYPSAIWQQLGRGDIVVFLLLLLTLLVIDKWMKNRNLPPLPPGPPLNRFPIFGYLPFLGGNQPVHEHFVQLAHQYGKIFHVRLGNKVMVIITCPQLLKQVYKQDNITGRPHSPLIDGVMEGYGISSAEGPLWKQQRQFALSNLRNLGMLRSNVQSSIRHRENTAKATTQLLEEFGKSNGQPIDIRVPLAFTVANIYTSTVISKTFDFFDPELMKEVLELEDSFRIIDSISIANFLPIFCYWPKFRKILKIIEGRRETTRIFHRKIIAEHRIDLDPQNPRDFVDAYLLQMDKDQQAGKQSYCTEIQMLSVLGDLFSAGTETTKITLLWAFLALTKHPQVQQTMQTELDDVIGRTRAPNCDDIKYLPYTQAVINEVLRFSSILSVGNPHCPSKDVTIEGYRIPKGALVVGLIWKFHHDPNTWKYPNDFNPENFLSSDGQLISKDEFLPFSVGRRMCVGQDIARNEIFAILTNVLHNFTLLPPDGEELPSLNDSRPGFLRMPIPYKIRIIPRN